jgi:signal transduction histidine kinase/CheY-like chemotaxis protein
MTQEWFAGVVNSKSEHGTIENRQIGKSRKITHVLWQCDFNYDKNGELVSVNSVGRDITEKKLLTEQLAHTQKMEAMGTLAGGIAHDFNNILSAIIGYTELAVSDFTCSKDSRENLDEVLTAAQRAKDLVSQILAFSRKSGEKKNIIHLQPILQEVLSLIRKTIPTTIEIEEHLLSKELSVNADPTQLHQVFMNLCTNAYQSMKQDGGRLTVSLECVDVNDRLALKVADLKEGPHAVVTISDNGVGIGQENIQRIFDPFFTTRGTGEGTGMGLAMVHGHVKNHRGAIAIQSELGVGTEFKIYLPLAEGQANGAADEQQGVLREGHEHILLVDDEPSLAKLGKRTLEALGYKVTAMVSAEDALDKFKQDPSSFDMIITDQTMPGITGDFLVKEAVAARSDIPAIICTGHSDILDEAKAIEVGAKALLMKPLARSTLSSIIREVLDRKG